MDQTASATEGHRFTPEQLESVAAGYDYPPVDVVAQANGTWAVVCAGSVIGTYPNQGMATELALYLNNPRGNPRPAWF